MSLAMGYGMTQRVLLHGISVKQSVELTPRKKPFPGERLENIQSLQRKETSLRIRKLSQAKPLAKHQDLIQHTRKQLIKTLRPPNNGHLLNSGEASKPLAFLTELHSESTKIIAPKTFNELFHTLPKP